MNKNLLVILACLFLTSSLFAQNPPAQNPQSGAVQRCSYRSYSRPGLYGCSIYARAGYQRR